MNKKLVYDKSIIKIHHYYSIGHLTSHCNLAVMNAPSCRHKEKKKHFNKLSYATLANIIR